jgi:hypothetical protein
MIPEPRSCLIHAVINRMPRDNYQTCRISHCALILQYCSKYYGWSQASGLLENNSTVLMPSSTLKAHCTHHRTSHAIVKGGLSRHNANVDKTLLPDAVTCQQILNLVDAHGESRDEVVNVFEQACAFVEH